MLSKKRSSQVFTEDSITARDQNPYTTTIFNESIRFPNTLSQSIKRAKQSNDTYDITVLAMSATRLKSLVFGDIGGTMRDHADRIKSASAQCNKAGVTFRPGITRCHLCQCNIKQGLQECEHILPLRVAIIFNGVETVKEVYKKMEKEGGLNNLALFHERTKTNYLWAHRPCNSPAKSGTNPTEAIMENDKLKIVPSNENIGAIMNAVVSLPSVKSCYSNKKIKVPYNKLKSEFYREVGFQCAIANKELEAIYKLFEGSGLSKDRYLKTIIDYYLSIFKLYASDELIAKLITPEQVEEMKRQKREKELENLKKFNELKNMFSQLKKENGKLHIFSTKDDITTYLKERIYANAGSLFYNRENIPEKLPRWIRSLNYNVRVRLIDAINKMMADEIVIDEELLSHLISFFQFYFSYKTKDDFKQSYPEEDGIKTRSGQVPIAVMRFENKTVSDVNIPDTETIRFKDICCQNLFTLLEKMGWVASKYYNESLIYDNLIKYFGNEFDFGEIVCENIFNTILKQRILSVNDYNPPELRSENMENEMYLDKILEFYTTFPPEKEKYKSIVGIGALGENTDGEYSIEDTHYFTAKIIENHPEPLPQLMDKIYNKYNAQPMSQERRRVFDNIFNYRAQGGSKKRTLKRKKRMKNNKKTRARWSDI
jgi:hypothetical protein